MEATSLDSLRETVTAEPAVLAYFSTPTCNVCKVLKPKVQALLDEEFPKVRFVYVDCAHLPDVAAQFSVHAVPTILVFFDGRETFRFGRHFGIEELRESMARPYGLLFD